MYSARAVNPGFNLYALLNAATNDRITSQLGRQAVGAATADYLGDLETQDEFPGAPDMDDADVVDVEQTYQDPASLEPKLRSRLGQIFTDQFVTMLLPMLSPSQQRAVFDEWPAISKWTKERYKNPGGISPQTYVESLVKWLDTNGLGTDRAEQWRQQQQAQRQQNINQANQQAGVDAAQAEADFNQQRADAEEAQNETTRQVEDAKQTLANIKNYVENEAPALFNKRMSEAVYALLHDNKDEFKQAIDDLEALTAEVDRGEQYMRIIPQFIHKWPGEAKVMEAVGNIQGKPMSRAKLMKAANRLAKKYGPGVKPAPPGGPPKAPPPGPPPPGNGPAAHPGASKGKKADRRTNLKEHVPDRTNKKSAWDELHRKKTKDTANRRRAGDDDDEFFDAMDVDDQPPPPPPMKGKKAKRRTNLKEHAPDRTDKRSEWEELHRKKTKDATNRRRGGGEPDDDDEFFDAADGPAPPPPKGQKRGHKKKLFEDDMLPKSRRTEKGLLPKEHEPTEREKMREEKQKARKRNPADRVKLDKSLAFNIPGGPDNSGTRNGEQAAAQRARELEETRRRKKAEREAANKKALAEHQKESDDVTQHYREKAEKGAAMLEKNKKAEAAFKKQSDDIFKDMEDTLAPAIQRAKAREEEAKKRAKQAKDAEDAQKARYAQKLEAERRERMEQQLRDARAHEQWQEEEKRRQHARMMEQSLKAREARERAKAQDDFAKAMAKKAAEARAEKARERAPAPPARAAAPQQPRDRSRSRDRAPPQSAKERDTTPVKPKPRRSNRLAEEAQKPKPAGGFNPRMQGNLRTGGFGIGKRRMKKVLVGEIGAGNDSHLISSWLRHLRAHKHGY